MPGLAPRLGHVGMKPHAAFARATDTAGAAAISREHANRAVVDFNGEVYGDDPRRLLDKFDQTLSQLGKYLAA